MTGTRKIETGKRIIEIQPKKQKDDFRPYPYFIDENGLVGRQDFWHGYPERLLGFSIKKTAGKIDVPFEVFWREPKKALGLYPVMKHKGDEWKTHVIPIEAVTFWINGKVEVSR